MASHQRRLQLLLVAVFASMGLSQKQQDVATWQLASSASLGGATGSSLSAPNFNATGPAWFPLTGPATVLAALLQNDKYPDLLYANNLDLVNAADFDVSWWYISKFMLNDTSASQLFTQLIFKGINYRANVWVNGVQIGNVDEVAGTFRYFEFDITTVAKRGGAALNGLAVEVFRPHNKVLGKFDPKQELDLAISFVDWSPTPPDSNMGLYREVVLSTTGPVTVRYPLVDTKLIDQQTVNLSVSVELTNWSKQTQLVHVFGVVHGTPGFDREVNVTAGATVVVTFNGFDTPRLIIKNPNFWWPWQMGTPTLSQLDIQATVNSVLSDSLTTTFGIREVTSGLDANGHRLYNVNGRPIFIAGAGWSPDLFLRMSPARQDIEMSYVKAMNLNTIRLEGKFEDDSFFQLADQYGLLIMPGWCCCDAWQRWKYWGPTQIHVAMESLRTQTKRLRIHPSVFVFLYGSDEAAPTDIEAQFLQVFQEERWPNPVLASASDLKTTGGGETGVKMSGPYSWVPPSYWLEDTDSVGGAFGFLTEGGPGENPLSLDSLRHTVSGDHIWTAQGPDDVQWEFHCGSADGAFSNLKRFTVPLEARYGSATSAEEYLYKSHVAAYEGHRAMFEAYSRNKYRSATGVIQWMLNNAFPEMIWHLYDYFLTPTPAYFATRKALEPLHLVYSTVDSSVYLVNSLYTPSTVLMMAIARVYNISGAIVHEQWVPITGAAADSSTQLFILDRSAPVTSTYLIRLSLTNSATAEDISINDYWLSLKPDVLDWNATTYISTPCSSFGDFSALSTLPYVNLSISVVHSSQQAMSLVTVKVFNPSPSVAFFVELRLINANSTLAITPVYWNDNYFTLLGGETRVFVATFHPDPLATVVWNTWNSVIHMQ